MPKKRRAPRFDPDPERFGYVVLIIAVALFLLACALPVDAQEARGGAYGFLLLLYGLWGLLVSLFWPFLLMLKPNMADFKGWLEMVRSEIPWLANPTFAWALVHFARGRVRQAWITALVAVLLAALFPFLYLQTFSALFVIPAYWCWLGSMVWLAAAAGYGDYLASRARR